MQGIVRISNLKLNPKWYFFTILYVRFLYHWTKHLLYLRIYIHTTQKKTFFGANHFTEVTLLIWNNTYLFKLLDTKHYWQGIAETLVLFNNLYQIQKYQKYLDQNLIELKIIIFINFYECLINNLQYLINCF